MKTNDERLLVEQFHNWINILYSTLFATYYGSTSKQNKQKYDKWNRKM